MQNKIRIDGQEFDIIRYDLQDMRDCTIQCELSVALSLYAYIENKGLLVIDFLEDGVVKAQGEMVYRNQHIESDSTGGRGYLSFFVVIFA